MSAINLSRFKTAVIIINVIAATMALANIAAMSTRVVEVEPLDDTIVWSLDIIDRRMLMQADINIKNNALYDIRDISVDAQLYLEDGTPLLHYRREGMVVPSVSNQAMPFMVSVSLTEAEVQRMASLLILDDLFLLDMKISATYLWGFGEFNMDQTFDFQWTSPLKRTVLEFLASEGIEPLLNGALASMDSGSIYDFFEGVNAPEIGSAFNLLGIAATIAEVDVNNETAYICMAVQYVGSAFVIGLTIPLSDIMSTQITFQEAPVHG